MGAGYAGAATAAELVARGVRNVLILESEPLPGHHGSGRNAAMARRLIEDPLLARLAVDSVARIDALADRRNEPLRETNGALLIGDRQDVEETRSVAASAPPLDVETEILDMAQATELVPALAGASSEAAIHSPECGIVDIHALLAAYLDEARAGGAVLKLRSPVVDIETAGGRVTGVRSQDKSYPCDLVVNAAGFCVNVVAEMAGLPPYPFDPVRRHLFVTARWPDVDRSWPFVWDLTHGLYFRPEGVGLLMCACDQTSWRPEAPPADPIEKERLAEKFSTHVPALKSARPTRFWAGLRVLTPDDRFVIGPDPDLEGFFWVAGLGGHGMTTSAGVGFIAGEGIVSGAVPDPYGDVFDPGRFER